MGFIEKMFSTINLKYKQCTRNIVSFVPTKYALIIVAAIAVYYTNYHMAKGLGMEHKEKSPAQNFRNILTMIMILTIVFVFGNYSKTFDEVTVLFMFIGMFIFAFMGEIPFMKISLMSIGDWTGKAWALMSILFLFIAYALFTLVILDADFCYQGMSYLGILLAIVLLFIVCYLVAKYGSNTTKTDVQILNDNTKIIRETKQTYHYHHWIIAFVLALLARFDNLRNKIIGGLALGVMIHGISQYEVNHIIMDKDTYSVEST